jgi:hypothetical protein
LKGDDNKEKQQARKSLHIALNTSSKTSTHQSDDGHGKTEAADTTKIKNSSDEKVPRTTNPVLTLPKGLEEDTFSPVVKPSPRPSNLTPHLNSMSVKKRKSGEPHRGLPPPPFRQEPSTTSDNGEQILGRHLNLLADLPLQNITLTSFALIFASPSFISLLQHQTTTSRHLNLRLCSFQD